MGDVSTFSDDPRLAHTGAEVEGREIIDDSVLLAGFERFLESGEAREAEDEDAEVGAAQVWELLGFIEQHRWGRLTAPTESIDNKGHVRASAITLAAPSSA
jgi:hypothetical protein